MSQKLRFFAVGTGDWNRWLGLFISWVMASFNRRIAPAAATFFPPFFESSRMTSSFCFSCKLWSFFTLSRSASKAFTLCWSVLILTATSSPLFLVSGVKWVADKKEGLLLRFSFGRTEVGGVERSDVAEGGVGGANDCAWSVTSFWCCCASRIRNSRFSFCRSCTSLTWSVSVWGTGNASSFALYPWKTQKSG